MNCLFIIGDEEPFNVLASHYHVDQITLPAMHLLMHVSHTLTLKLYKIAVP